MVKNLSLVFDRLKCARLKLKPKKCILFKDIINFWAIHYLQKEYLHVQTRSRQFRNGRCQDVRSFIDLCSYSRIFVREFATIAKLLHDLTANDESFK